MPGLAAVHGELARLMRGQKRIAEAELHMAQAQKLRETGRRRRAEKSAGRKVDLEAARAAKALEAPSVAAFERWDGEPPRDRSRVVTIVTGLPRSGTSMMMQMLSAAGIEAYTDGRREADEDNPRGYFEHDKAARLNRDAAWIPEARGKAVKIVAHLTPFLPAGEQYRLVFMRRDLKEVAASQKAMLERLGRKGGRIGDAGLMRTYAGQLVRVQSWLRKTAGVQVLTVDYAEALRDAKATAERLANFLGGPFDVQAAAAQVDASLRRQYMDRGRVPSGIASNAATPASKA
jgi:hypothetical protein